MDGQQCKQPTGMMVAIVDMVVFSGLAARTLHMISQRAAQPFLPVNCGAVAQK